MVLRILTVALFWLCSGSWSNAASPDLTDSTEETVISIIFTLRSEKNLPPIQRNDVLNRVAGRVSSANLERENFISHTDQNGKTLLDRTEEEAYPGAAGEIVAVILQPCSKAQEKDFVPHVAESFKRLIRGSPGHYDILISAHNNWNEYGISLLETVVTRSGQCFKKFSLALVMGLQN